MKRISSSVVAGLGISFLMLPLPSFASDECSGLQAVSSSADCTGTSLQNTINNNIVPTLFTVAGAVAVIIIIIGGIRYITSTGDASRIKTSKDTILYAVIGLVVVIVAREIVGFVVGSLF